MVHGRREQALEKRYPGLFKPRAPRGLLHGNAVETLIKKRNVPQKLSPHGKRCARAPGGPSEAGGIGGDGDPGSFGVEVSGVGGKSITWVL